MRGGRERAGVAKPALYTTTVSDSRADLGLGLPVKKTQTATPGLGLGLGLRKLTLGAGGTRITKSVHCDDTTMRDLVMICAIIAVTPAIAIVVPSDVQRSEAIALVGSTRNGDHVAVQSTQTKSLLNESQVRPCVGGFRPGINLGYTAIPPSCYRVSLRGL